MSSVILNYYTFLLPTSSFNITYDIIKQNRYPSIIDISLNLIASLNEVNAYELQKFFKLSSLERDVLVDDLLSTDLCRLNEDGNLIPSSNLSNLIDNNYSIFENKIERLSAMIYIEHASGNILPTRFFKIQSNFSLISENLFYKKINSVDAADIFSLQFARFKLFYSNGNINSHSVRLYRINSCYYEEKNFAQFNLGVSAIANHDQFSITTNIENLVTHNDEIAIDNCDIKPALIKLLDVKRPIISSVKISDFCDIIDDYSLLDYFSEEYFDIELYFRYLSEQSYLQDFRSILGPIWLDHNYESFLSMLKFAGNVKFVIWIPPNSNFWGSSIYACKFVSNLRKSYEDIVISVILPYALKFNDRLKFFYTDLCNYTVFMRNFIKNNEVEILFVVGDQNICYIGYNSHIPNKYNLGALSFPIGFITSSKDRIQRILDYLKSLINFSSKSDMTSINVKFSNGYEETISKFFE